MPERERLTVLQSAADQGIQPGSPAFCLLEHWLLSEPNPKLGQAWEHYIRALCRTLTPDARETLRKEVMSRARAVARSAHGILGAGHLADEEKRTLQRLGTAFAEP